MRCCVRAALFPNTGDADAVEVVASDLFHLQARTCIRLMRWCCCAELTSA